MIDLQGNGNGSLMQGLVNTFGSRAPENSHAASHGSLIGKPLWRFGQVT